MTGRDVPHDNLQRNDPNLFDQGLTVIQFLRIMGGDSLCSQLTHQQVRHAVVDRALSDNRSSLCPVERRRVIFIGDNHERRIIRCKYLFGFSLVELFSFFHMHRTLLPSEKQKRDTDVEGNNPSETSVSQYVGIIIRILSLVKSL